MLLRRQVAYNELQSPRRRLLHRRVAEALERVYANNLDSVFGQIALHYEQAGVVERAIAFYQRTAEVAERIYAHTEALIAYRRALALLEAAPSREDQHEKLAQLHERVGEVLFLTGQYDEAKLAYESALSHVPNHDCIWQAHLHRESGEIFSAQHRYTEALQAYSTAEAVLGQESATLATEWIQEWIAIQSDRIDIHYWLGQVDEMTELVEKTRPILEQYGTPTQSARFFLNLALMSSRRDRYVMSEEILGYARSALSASQEAGDVMQIALAMAERTGDVILQSRCLTYLTTLYRKRGQVKGTKDYASHALTIATAMNMLEYIAMAKANLAWVAWQAGLPDEVELLGRTALELWHQPPTASMVYPFDWTALWPLISVELGQKQTSAAIEDAHKLLAPTQQPMPATLAAIIGEAIQAWDSGQMDMANTRLQRATALAQEMGYL